MKNEERRHVIIMSGGVGQRLGPVSTEKEPKQFHALVSEKTLLQETFSRVSSLARRDRVHVSTTPHYVDIVCQQLPDLLDDNVIVEPCARDTMPAIAYVAQMICNLDPEAVVVTTPSDHAVKNLYDFVNAVQTAFAVVEEYPERLGLLGIKPTEPSTALGYMRRGNEVQGFNQVVFEVDEFKEKPEKDIAEKYCLDGEHYWNGGYFIFKVKTMLELVQQHAPRVADVIKQLKEIKDKEERKTIFSTLSKEPIDKAIFEKISKEQRFVVPADLGWSDVGTWNALHAYCQKDHGGNVCRGDVVSVDSEDNLVFATEKKVVTFGVKDLVIIETGEVIAVFNRSCSDDIKQVTHLLKKE